MNQNKQLQTLIDWAKENEIDEKTIPYSHFELSQSKELCIDGNSEIKKT